MIFVYILPVHASLRGLGENESLLFLFQHWIFCCSYGNRQLLFYIFVNQRFPAKFSSFTGKKGYSFGGHPSEVYILMWVYSLFGPCGNNRQLLIFFFQVEIQVFGPFIAGRRHAYVAVALDCYSQFPEAMVIENISAATLTTFVVNLICRYSYLCLF